MNDPPEKILNFSRTLEIMVICASEETGRPINKGLDQDNDNICEGAHVLIASEDFFSTLTLP